MAKPLLIGQAPGPGRVADGNGRPLSGARAAGMLARLAGVSREQFLRRVDTINVLDSYPGPARGGKGDAFPLRLARRKAAILWPSVRRRQRIVFVGKDVARAFNIDPDYYAPCWWWLHPEAYEFAWLPHPSGVNRWYNLEGNRAKAEGFLRDLLGLERMTAHGARTHAQR